MFKMKRRTVLKAIAGVGIVGSLALGLKVGKDLYLKNGAIRFGHLRSEAELKELERLAIKTQEGMQIYDKNNSSTKLSGFLGYEHSFQMAIGDNFSYQKYLSKLKKRNFPYDKHLIVADIGGSYGTAAEELQAIEGIEAFVIDPAEYILQKSNKLPKNRFFVQGIENTGLPDKSFHFMTSYNSYQYIDLPRSFTEPYRLLKKGGSAILQIQQFGNLKFLEQLNSLKFRENISVAFGAIKGDPMIVPLPKFIKGPEAIHKKFGEKAEGMLSVLMNPAFIIDKK